MKKLINSPIPPQISVAGSKLQILKLSGMYPAKDHLIFIKYTCAWMNYSLAIIYSYEAIKKQWPHRSLYYILRDYGSSLVVTGKQILYYIYMSNKAAIHRSKSNHCST